jgi:hypothetical protein
MVRSAHEVVPISERQNDDFALVKTRVNYGDIYLTRAFDILKGLSCHNLCSSFLMFLYICMDKEVSYSGEIESVIEKVKEVGTAYLAWQRHLSINSIFSRHF